MDLWTGPHYLFLKVVEHLMLSTRVGEAMKTTGSQLLHMMATE